jgi:hypothetical protein
MELHDSKLLRWELRGADLVARLDAYVHVSLGVPGEDAGTGWSQELELVVRGARVSEEPRELPMWIADGVIRAAGEALLLVPVPLEGKAAVEVTLAGAEGRLAVSGAGVSLTAAGQPRFVERFDGG